MALKLDLVAPGVHRVSSLYTNWYLLEEGGRLTVLDAGLPGDWRQFSSHLTRLGYSLDDIDAILITHHHLDHAGNAERLRSHGARVFAHAEDADSLRGDRQVSVLSRLPYLRRPWYAQYMMRIFIKGVTRAAPVTDISLMSDGDVLDVPGRPRVLHVPGHTAGSCALFKEDRSVLFTGDALVTQDVARGRLEGPQVVLGPDTEDAKLAFQSLDALAATKAETVLPGHGEPWDQGVETAVQAARLNLDTWHR